ncbi:MAG: zinc ribbon domain-containing protein [Acidobacteriota bacterium]
MKCRACGTEIADKAIVCFRCGTPTDIPQAPVRPAVARRRPAWIAVLLLILIIALGVWLLPMTPRDSVARWAGWAALAVVTVATVRWLRRRR